MEVDKGSDNKITVVIYEMLGTALFLYGILVSRGQELAVPLTLFACIVIFGNVTGGHFNPAVSLGVWIARGKLLSDLVFLLMIIVGQLVGAFLAIALAWLSLFAKFDDKFSIRTPAYACPVDVNDAEKACDGADGNGFHYDFQAIYTQVICTFIFVSVILMVKGIGKENMAPTSDGMLGPLTVALTLAGLI